MIPNSNLRTPKILALRDDERDLIISLQRFHQKFPNLTPDQEADKRNELRQRLSRVRFELACAEGAERSRLMQRIYMGDHSAWFGR